MSRVGGLRLSAVSLNCLWKLLLISIHSSLDFFLSFFSNLLVFVVLLLLLFLKNTHGHLLSFKTNGFFPKWNGNSVKFNDKSLKHESGQFKDPVCHLCLAGSVVKS